MALIRKLEKGNSNIRPHDSEVDATYQIIDNGYGEHLIHLATYGSDYRKSGAKVSQTVQLDRDTAMELGRIIDSVFGRG